MHIQIGAQPKKEMAILDYRYEVVPSKGNYSWAQYELGLRYRSSGKAGPDYGLHMDLQRRQPWFYEVPQPVGMEEPDELYRVETGADMTWKMSTNRRFHARFSTFLASDLNRAPDLSDLQYAAALSMTLGKGADSQGTQWKFGLEYGILRTRRLFHPLLSWIQPLSPKLKLELGFPLTALHFNINPWHTLRATGNLKGKYTDIHLPETTPDDLPQGAVRLVDHAFDLTLEHSYQLRPQWQTLIRVGFLIDHKAMITDKKGAWLHDLSPGPSVYLSMGLAYSILN